MLICRFFVVIALIMISLVAPASAGDEDYKNLEIFTDVYSLIRTNYVEEIDAQELIYGAIKGMLDTLDPHSNFLTPEMYLEMQADTHGEFGGLGIEISIKNNTLLVVSPIEGTPADRAGIQSGDQIVVIDGVATEDIGMVKAVSMLRGPKGKDVTLVIKRSGAETLLTLKLTRDTIQIESVKGHLIGDSYGYARVAQFQDRTTEDLRSLLEELKKSAPGQVLQGLILDLRNNPGGLLDQAVAVSDLFIADGLIVYTEGRDPESQLRFSAHNENTEPAYPLIVLINSGSASAAEIVSGALQDHHRAVIMGEQSFGKGSVQTMIPLDDDSGLKLTTARYFTPSGRSIQALGIVPDIVVPKQISRDEADLDQVREADLDNHFQPIEEPVDTGTDPLNAYSEPAAVGDYQLRRAVDLLKGYSLLSRQGNQN